MQIRDAHPDEREALEELQRRASTHLPTYRDELLAHPDAIVLPAEQIVGGDVRVALRDGVVIGFAVVLGPHGGACELDGLFVEPGRWRGGVGRALIEDSCARARARGAARIEVIANPDALGFYERVGFVVAGEDITRFGPAARMVLGLSGRFGGAATS